MIIQGNIKPIVSWLAKGKEILQQKSEKTTNKSGSVTINKEQKEIFGTIFQDTPWWVTYQNSILFILIPIVASIATVLLQNVFNRWTALLWSLSFLAVGSFFGFLFGFPKVNPSQNRTSQKSLILNSNLEQISDWLTKAIVGVSLFKLHGAPEFFKNIVIFITSNNPDPNISSTAGAIVLLFLSLGFLGGYINTSIYFTEDYRNAEKDYQDGAILKED